jgi:hypothetical protein
MERELSSRCFFCNVPKLCLNNRANAWIDAEYDPV